ncbi:MAG: tRNA (adenosine(37)-N6)-threonylcarbamoyltransferase complex dimerization subunit type 1 TsaB [Rhodospirillales bacterium]|nr:tRNA (adenosine(37)-N6)-threonylcarbamoyltransferase complex dimerization subunit type 1 TsaB [Rhodospirillales bacterium]
MKTTSTNPVLTLLALDSATTGCAVCVWQDGRVLAVERETMARGQAQELMPMVDRVLAAAGVSPSDLSAVAVTRGPGAFTGLRIALAAARGFALALAVPCVGVTTLEVVAHGVPASMRDGRTLLVCVESKREDLYVQVFSPALEPLSEPLACDDAALVGLFETGERVLLVGDAAARAVEILRRAGMDAVLSDASPLPDPAIIAELAAVLLNRGQSPGDFAAPEPLYLRPPDAKLPKAEGRLRG